MRERHWEIGMCGTFDVANYGDLLFPLIAEAELKKRLGSVTLHRFAYRRRSPPEWPFEVSSLTTLPEKMSGLDGLLIGGGFVIRFDKDVAPGYYPPTPAIHHPTGYWLSPALIAIQQNVPVIWNAPGTDGIAPPAWAGPLMDQALKLSHYVAVRDEASRVLLGELSDAPIALVPDTAFGLPGLLALSDPPTAEFARVADEIGLGSRYIVIQASPGLDGFVRFISNHAERFRGIQFLVLPIGPVLGDRTEVIGVDLPCLVRLASWPKPLLISEMIGRAEAVVGHSYHLFIAAIASGVPVFARPGLPPAKYSVLESSDAYSVLPLDQNPDIDWFLSRVGRRPPCQVAQAAVEPLRKHWDRVAEALQAGCNSTSAATTSVSSGVALSQFWQTLPALLEQAAMPKKEDAAPVPAQVLERHDAIVKDLSEHLAAAQQNAAAAQARLADALDDVRRAQDESAERQSRLNRLLSELTVARIETAARDARIGELMSSLSWKVTALPRWIGRWLQEGRRRRVMNLEYIRRHTLETKPYRWAAINGLFNEKDALSLSETYPLDHFKLVSDYGCERNYEYEARALIGMGADVISHPEELSEAWQALAADLLSPEYRAAMTTLTGCDLSHAPMEVNVFHYGPGASLDAHPDLPDKLATHVLYFNKSWNPEQGGCLRILRSSNPLEIAAEIPPIVGYSAVIVRSENSWHIVPRVSDNSCVSRRSMTVTFYRPGSVSTMWPPGDTAALHRYRATD